MKTCFEGLARIRFTEEEDSREIVAMISAKPEDDRECVNFAESVFAEGQV